MSEMFAAPASSAGFDYEAALGHLLVISPSEIVEGVQTVNGVRDAVRCDIVDVDDPDLSVEDALVFPKVLISSLRSRLGQKVLGHLKQGVAKPGQNAPWMLEDASTDPKAVKSAQAAIKGAGKPAAAASKAPF